MRILKRLWSRFVEKKVGLTHPSSIVVSFRDVPLASVARVKLKKSSIQQPWIILLVSLLSSSCGTVTRPDPVAAYTSVGYRSVEMNLCGKNFFGVGGCSFASGDSANVVLEIQGYYKGEITIFSEPCRVDWKQRYGMHEAVSVTLADLFGTQTFSRSHSCSLRVLVSPDPIEGSEEPVFPRSGEIYIEVRSPGVADLGLPVADQVRESEEIDAGFKLHAPLAGEFLLAKCDGSRIQEAFSPGEVIFPALDRKGSCKYQYAVRMGSQKLSGVFLRSVFMSSAVLLSRPKITREGKKICVEADPTATFVAINDKWVNRTSICVEDNGPFKVRVWTTKRNYFEVVP